jgi:hypothetical protein
MATAKKAPAKKAAATKAPAKAPAKKVAAAKAPAKKAAAKPKASAEETAAKKAAAEEKRAARDAERDGQIEEVLRLRREGEKWPEVAESVGISLGKAQLLFQIGEARERGLKKPTPAAILKDRDEKQMGWVEIATQYGITKGTAQKMYREAGGDPHKSYIGKGGRYFSHEDAIAPLREAARSESTSKPKAKKAAAAAGKPVFGDDDAADDIKAKVSGKTITVHSVVKGTEKVDTFKVKPESAKVGKQKDGTRVVQFTDAATGGTRTVKLATIVKVAR